MARCPPSAAVMRAVRSSRPRRSTLAPRSSSALTTGRRPALAAACSIPAPRDSSSASTSPLYAAAQTSSGSGTAIALRARRVGCLYCIEQGENTGRHRCIHRNTTPCTVRILVQTRHTDAIYARAACALDVWGQKERLAGGVREFVRGCVRCGDLRAGR
eukprot:scaffold127404_cov75-Phaeocystis_antarctica.AAC.1